MYQLLVVDSNYENNILLKNTFEDIGYKVSCTQSAEEALNMKPSNFDLIITDVVLGETSGFKLARILKSNPETSKLPIVFITARSDENDKLTGFALGASDYITKPFNIKELIARINAIIRRTSHNPPDDMREIQYGTLTINLQLKKVMLGKSIIFVRPKEFELLRLLVENKNKVLNRNEIVSKVWPEEAGVLNRTVDVNITRLRKKLGPYGKKLVTRMGFGYCFED